MGEEVKIDETRTLATDEEGKAAETGADGEAPADEETGDEPGGDEPADEE